jgi:hypothetical protein
MMSAHHFEIDEGFQADTAKALEVAHAGDANHHGRENDRGNHHPDEPDESGAQRLHPDSNFREEMTCENPQKHPHEDPKIKLGVKTRFDHAVCQCLATLSRSLRFHKE